MLFYLEYSHSALILVLTVLTMRHWVKIDKKNVGNHSNIAFVNSNYGHIVLKSKFLSVQFSKGDRTAALINWIHMV